MRKFESIDLMKLHALGSANGWNDMLNDCLQKMDINRLAKIRYQIQAGMDDLAKAKLNTEEMITWFLRLNRSLEITAKRILKGKHPMPHDDGAVSRFIQNLDATEQKKKRDQDLAAFFRDSAY